MKVSIKKIQQYVHKAGQILLDDSDQCNVYVYDDIAHPVIVVNWKDEDGEEQMFETTTNDVEINGNVITLIEDNTQAEHKLYLYAVIYEPLNWPTE
jgi:hypothetical protein